MQRLALQIICLMGMLCNCKAQTVATPTDTIRQNKSETQQIDSVRAANTPSFRVLSVENTDTLRWTGKAFTGRHKNKGNTWLIKAVMKGMNPNWQRHALWVTVKDVWLLRDGVEKDVISVMAFKSAETRWSISAFKREKFMVEECKAPLYAIPYFIDGCAYIICIIPPFQKVGDEFREIIERKALYEDVLKPLMDKPFF